MNVQQSEESRRIVQLQGGHNFRDLGGYVSADGRQVRWGRLYRSAALDGLTPSDYQQLESLGIRVFCDLRSTKERRMTPVALPPATRIEYWARDYAASAGNLLSLMSRLGTTEEQMRDTMIAIYRSLPYEQATAYRELFQRVANDQLPMVFACAAGKDRTGIAAALLLDALGVPRETTIEDYLITERYLEVLRRRISNRYGNRLRDVAPNVWAPIVRAHRSYIEAMFSVIDERHGSVVAYLATQLGVDSIMLTQIRNNVLE